MIREIEDGIKKDFTCPYCNKIMTLIYNKHAMFNNAFINQINISSIKHNCESFSDLEKEFFNYFSKFDYVLNKIKNKKNITFQINEYCKILNISCINSNCSKNFIILEYYKSLSILKDDIKNEIEKLSLGLTDQNLFKEKEFLIKSIPIFPEFSLDPNIECITDNCVKKDYIEAIKIKDISYNGSAILLRRAINRLLLKLYDLPSNTHNLYNLINEVCLINDVSENIKDTLHSIRNIGNIAAHPDENDIEISKKDIDELFILMSILIEDTYVKKFQDQERERKRKESIEKLDKKKET